MQNQNDYDKEVYNGDIGYIHEVDLADGELVASFDGRAVTYAFGELDTLVPAYAATIHKSQGSEYPAVVIPVMTQHYTMLQRNLLYTGVRLRPSHAWRSNWTIRLTTASTSSSRSTTPGQFVAADKRILPELTKSRDVVDGGG